MSPSTGPGPRRRGSLRRPALSLLGAAALAASLAASTTALAGPASGQSPSRHAGPVLVGAPAVVPAGFMHVGTLAPTAAIHGEILLTVRNLSELARVASAVSTPGSALHGAYLSRAQVASRYLPTAAQVGAVRRELGALGLSVGRVTSGRLGVHFSGSARAVGVAFHTSFAAYRGPTGRIGYGNVSAPSLPAALAPAVSGLLGLSNLARYHAAGLALSRPASATVRTVATRLAPRTTGPQPCASAVNAAAGGGYTANQLAARYGMSKLYGAGDLGSGVTVALYELEPNSKTDIARYESCYGISTAVNYLAVDGYHPVGSGLGEAALDIEDVAGLAPKSTIDVYQAPNNVTGPFDEIQQIVTQDKAKVVSSSWGICESQLTSTVSAKQNAIAESAYFQIAAAEGQSWMAASGDWGSTDCGNSNNAPLPGLAVDDPGAQPYVTSVGGTSLRKTSTSFAESVWNDSFSSSDAGGGGISRFWSMPAYQAAAPASLGVVNAESSGKPCGVTSGYCREVPDVSASADPQHGYVVYYAGGWNVFGGTSAAAPLWGALVALTDASTGTSGCKGTPVGFLNPALYKVASVESAYDASFHDITSGTNDYTPSGYAGGKFKALAGFDMASGLGTPIAAATSGSALATGLCKSLSAVPVGIDSLTPATGPAAGGGVVTIRGYGLSKVTSVYFGPAKAPSFVYVPATSTAPPKIHVVVPAGTGAVYVRLHTANTVSARTAGARYTYG